MEGGDNTHGLDESASAAERVAAINCHRCRYRRGAEVGEQIEYIESKFGHNFIADAGILETGLKHLGTLVPF